MASSIQLATGLGGAVGSDLRNAQNQLIFVEFAIITPLIRFWVGGGIFGFAQVIWVIGISMVILGALVHLPVRAIAGIGVGLIVLHNATDVIRIDLHRSAETLAKNAVDRAAKIDHAVDVVNSHRCQSTTWSFFTIGTPLCRLQ